VEVSGGGKAGRYLRGQEPISARLKRIAGEGILNAAQFRQPRRPFKNRK
jgi:hypothetical protein